MKNTLVIIAADTSVAILSGLAIVPAAFALGGEGAELAGPKLLFVTLQDIFASMGSLGPLFGVIFYLLVLIAALTSAIALTEVLITFFLDRAALKMKSPTAKRFPFGFV